MLQAISDSCDDAESLANVVWKMIKKKMELVEMNHKILIAAFKDLLTNKINEMDIVGKSKEKIASTTTRKLEFTCKKYCSWRIGSKTSIK